ncbi:fimbrillin family protein [Parabacteroides sp. PF5-9]|uniref:fimbrillin family protein n=1 Tax=Parabacteroides sp. PF5-9 TaxID=1742404 RepID=UPI00247408AA|nr:fimbrillin family protein [Parabacteroides sp. PF5-9]MDH6358756.1 hypothetical protein [Parabacteroides sp. PF5-9]
MGKGNGDIGKPAEDGFTMTVNDWGGLVEVPMAGGSPRTHSSTADLRAAVNTYATIPDFVVNGIHTNAGNWSYIFNEQYVYKPESGLIWTYEPKKYWPQAGEVDFYAYAPAGIRNFITGLNNNGDGTSPPVIEYKMPYKTNEEPPYGTGEPTAPLVVDDNQEDLLVAVQNSELPWQTTDPVHFTFRHAFSRVFVKAKSEQNDNRYRIKVVRVELRNLYTQGKLELKADNTSDPISTGIPVGKNEQFRYGSSGDVILWSGQKTPADYHFNLLSSAVTVKNDYTTLLNSDDGVFVMPQVVQSNTALYVAYDIYTVSQTDGEQYHSSASKLLPFASGFAFEIGKQYEIQATLNVP